MPIRVRDALLGLSLAFCSVFRQTAFMGPEIDCGLILVRPMRALRPRHLSRLLLLTLAVVFRSGVAGETPNPIEGVYHLHNGYQSETLELRNGHFRYWFWTDGGAHSGARPLEGLYSIDGSTLTLRRNDILLGNQRIFHPIKGIDALWRPEAFELWLTKGTINHYGVIVRVPHPPDDL
jgi:hypothetical protein